MSMDWFNVTEWGSPMDWGVALGLATLTFLVLGMLRRGVRAHYRKMLATDHTEWLELPFGVLARTTLAFFVAVGLFVGLKFLQLPPRVGRWLDGAVAVLLFWQLGVWLSAAFLAWLDRKRRHSMASDRAQVGSLSIIGLVVRGLIWVLVTLLALDNLGINITALVAGLGIGGVAVALALQNILGDLFASLAIALDQPFVVGDALAVGDIIGTVESIGIKSTRLRSLSGEQVIISNADLLSSRLRNYGRMAERRVVFTLNLTYDTPAEVLAQVPALVREAIEAQSEVRFDRCHFNALGAHSLDFECVYYKLSSDYNLHMDTLHAVNLALVREFNARDIEFAFPTRTVHIASMPAGQPEGPPAGSD